MVKRRFISLLLCLVLVMSLFTGFTVSASADDVINHTVVNGDYLFKVCKSYGLDYYQCKQAIMALNGFTSEQQLNKISVGQQIKLPGSNALAASVKSNSVTTVATTTTIGGTTTTTTTSTASGALGGYNVEFYLVPHVVASGETLNSICNGLGTSYGSYSNMILGMSGISNANSIKAGKTVYIPTKTAPASGSCYAVIAHTVSSGENLTNICSQYGVNYASNKQLINGLNAGKDVNRISAGQKVYIPVAASAAGVASGISSASTVAPVAQGAYTIGFDATSYGAPYATINGAKVTSANQGDKIQIVSNADVGYNIKSVSVMRLDTRANILVSENTFIMPSSNVAITVQYSPAMKLTKASATNGMFSLLVNGSEEVYANYGDVITVLPTPDSSYAATKVTYKKTGESTEKSVIQDANGDYKFNMPNYPVTVTVYFAKANYYKIDTTKTGTGTGAVYYAYNGSQITKAAVNTKVTVYLVPDEGSVVRSVKVNGKAINDSDNYGLVKENDDLYTFKMPESAVTVTAEFYKTVTYKVYADENVEHGTVAIVVYDKVTNEEHFDWLAKAGDTVVIRPLPNSGWKFDPSQSGVLYANGSSGIAIQPYDSSVAGYTFTMPEADVWVRHAWRQDSTKRYNIGMPETENGTYYCVVEDGNGNRTAGTTSAQGKKVDVYISPNAGYSVAVEGGTAQIGYYDASGAPHSMTEVVKNEHYQFTMPGNDVAIAMKLAKAWDFAEIKVDIPDIGSVKPGIVNVWCEYTMLTGNPLNARVGEYLVFSTEAKEGYTLKSLTVNGNKVGEKGGAAKLSDTEYGYEVQTADVSGGIKVKATFEAANYTIQYSDPKAAHGSYYDIFVDGTNKGHADVTNAHVGQTVELQIKKDSKDILEQVIVDGIDVTADLEKSTESGYDYVYTYTMKAAKSVTKVTFQAAAASEPKYSVSAGTLINATVSFDKTSAKPGETVTVTPVLPIGYIVDSVVLRDAYGNDITASYMPGPGYKFTMPSCDVTVDVTASEP